MDLAQRATIFKFRLIKFRQQNSRPQVAENFVDRCASDSYYRASTLLNDDLKGKKFVSVKGVGGGCRDLIDQNPLNGEKISLRWSLITYKYKT